MFVRVSRKAPISYVVSVHPSVRLFPCINCSQLGRIYQKFDTGDFSPKFVEKIRIWLKSTQNFGRFMKTQVCCIVACDINDSISALFEMVSGSCDSWGGVNITRTRYSVTSYVHCVPCFITRIFSLIQESCIIAFEIFPHVLWFQICGYIGICKIRVLDPSAHSTSVFRFYWIRSVDGNTMDSWE